MNMRTPCVQLRLASVSHDVIGGIPAGHLNKPPLSCGRREEGASCASDICGHGGEAISAQCILRQQLHLAICRAATVLSCAQFLTP